MFALLSRPALARLCLPALLLALQLPAAFATPEAPPPRPLPQDPSAAVPPLVYRPALQHYRPLPELQLQPWRESNERVARIGGWRAYAREAQQGASAPAAAHQH